jgi:hypothetical protein
MRSWVTFQYLRWEVGGGRQEAGRGGPKWAAPRHVGVDSALQTRDEGAGDRGSWAVGRGP